MKSTTFLFSALFALTLISCKDEKKETTTYVAADTTATSVPVQQVATASLTEGKSVVVTTDKVPDSVEMSFKKKYPKVLTPQWIEYTPVQSDEMPMDKTYYSVHFTDNGADMTTWFDNMGDWVRTSTVIPGDSRLPDPVNKALNAQYPDYKIESISKDNDKNTEVYKIKMNKGDDKVKLKITPQGEIVKLK